MLTYAEFRSWAYAHGWVELDNFEEAHGMSVAVFMTPTGNVVTFEYVTASEEYHYAENK